MNQLSSKAPPRPRKNHFRRWRRVLWRSAKAMTRMETSMRCAGVAYFGFLLLFPAISIVILLVGLLASPDFLADTVEWLDGLIPEVARQALAGQLAALIAQPRAGLGIGLAISSVAALWSGSRGVAALIFATSLTQREPEHRGLVMSVIVAVLATIAGALAMIVALTLVAAIPAVFAYLPGLEHRQEAILLLRWPILFCFSAPAIAVFYGLAPSAKGRQTRRIWPGALIATLLWLLACGLFSFYVESLGHFEATFGSLATAIVLLLWMYNSALILVLGATINAELDFETLAERLSPLPLGER